MSLFEHDWRGNTYEVGSVVLYPRSYANGGTEMAQGLVLEFKYKQKMSGKYLDAVKILPQTYSRSRGPWVGRVGSRPFWIRNTENITVL